MADLGSIKKELGDITNLLNTVAEDANRRLASSLKDSAKHVGDISEYFKHILKTSSKIPKDVKTVADLERKIGKDAKYRKEIVEKISEIHKVEVKDYWKKVEKFSAKQTDDINEQIKIEDKFAGSIQKATEALEKQLDTLEPKTFGQKLKAIGAIISAYFVGQIVKFKEGLAKFPKAFAKSMISTVGQKDFKSAVETFATPFLDLADSIPVVGGVIKFALQALIKVFFVFWEHVEKRVFPTNIALIKQFGSLSGEVRKLGGAALSMGMRFEAMGLGFKDGMEAVVSFGAALKTTNFKQFGENAKGLIANLGVRLQKVLGLSASQAGNLGIAFEKSGVGLKTLNPAMDDAAVAAKKLGVPINQVRKDMGENIGIMQRFGIANRMEFNKASALARHYGLSIEKVNASFGQQMDSFEKTSDVAAKLNAIFGTHINSYKLMLETDPSKRMAMLGKELQKQGKNWETLNVFEKNVLKTTLNMDDATGALVFSQKNIGKSYDDVAKKLSEQEKKKKAILKADEMWKNTLRSLRERIFNFAFAMKRIAMAIGDVIFKFLGYKDGVDAVTKGGKELNKFVNKIVDAIKKWDKEGGMKALVEDTKNFVRGLQDAFKAISSIADVVNALTGGLGEEAVESIEKAVAGRVHIEGMTVESIKRLRDDPKFMKEMYPKGMDVSELHAFGERLRTVGDALITKKGEVIKFSPQDNILATKGDPLSVGSGALIQEVRAMRKELRNTQSIKVEVIDLNMDGKKVGEGQVRISRN